MKYIILIFYYSYLYLNYFSEKEKNIETKTEHELNEINSFETALIEQHNLSHNELLQQSEILNELPHQQQPVIVRTPTKLSRLLLDDSGKLIFIFLLLFGYLSFFFYIYR